MIQHIALTLVSKKFIYSSGLALAVIALTVDPMVFSAAAVIVIGAIAAAAKTIINALGVAKKELLKLQLEIIEKQAALLATAKVIEGHVDGMTSRAEAGATADKDTITSLRQQLSDSEGRARMLAQAKTNVDLATAIPATPKP